MKKIISTLLVLFAASMLFAASSYTVKKVVGKVTFEVTPGKSKDVKEGQVLTPSTIINTGVNASIEITSDDGTELKISAMQKGTVEELTAALAKATGKLKKAPAAPKKSIAGEVEGTTSGASTASSRAGLGEDEIIFAE